MKSITRILIEHGADLGSICEDANHPLHLLALYRDLTTLKEETKATIDLLLESGADLNALNRYAESPLYKAAFRYDCKLVSYFLDKGAAPLAKGRVDYLAIWVVNLAHGSDVFHPSTKGEVDNMIQRLQRLCVEETKPTLDNERSLSSHNS